MTIKIGVLATLSGPFVTLGEDSVRGVEIALAEFNYQVAGHDIELLVESTLIDPLNAELATRKLLDEDNVDLIVGPLSGNEGLRVKQLAKQYPHKTFLNGTSGAQELTLIDPAPNLFNFAMTGCQLMKGLATYAYKTLGYKNIAVISEDYSYPHAQYGAFKLEFCGVGGKIVRESWQAVMVTSGYKSFIEEIPQNTDAVFALLGGSDAIQFSQDFRNARAGLPLLSGAIQADQTVLSYPDADPSTLIGSVTAGATADDNPNPAWKAFVETYRKHFPDGYGYPSYFALSYYLNTKAALLGIEQVNGKLDDDQVALRHAISQLSFEGPSGEVSLDHNRGVITTNYISRVERDNEGRLYRKLLQTIPKVNQTLGMDEEEFKRLGTFNKNNPQC